MRKTAAPACAALSGAVATAGAGIVGAGAAAPLAPQSYAKLVAAAGAASPAVAGLLTLPVRVVDGIGRSEGLPGLAGGGTFSGWGCGATPG